MATAPIKGRVDGRLLAVGLIAAVVTAGAVELAPVTGPAKLHLIGAARLALIAAILAHAARRTGLTAIGLGPGHIRSGLLLGLAWSAWFGLIAGAGMAAMLALGLNPKIIIGGGVHGPPGLLAAYALVGGIIAPAAEEILFRGVIYGYLRRWGVFVAVVVTTLAFTLLHLPLGQIPVTQAIGGIVFALAYEKTGRLACPITIHALGNLALFFLPLWLP
jgi:hypothetical protein